MKVAYLVAHFPVRSETFVANQILGMAARGCDVTIFASENGSGEPGLAVRRLELEKRVLRLDAPPGRVARIARIVPLLLAHGWRSPRTVMASLDFRRHGRLAASLRLLHCALAIGRAGPRRFDIIHAQFGPQGALASRLVEIGALEGPIVTSFRGYDATSYLRMNPLAYRELFRTGTLFLPVSRALASRVVEAGCDPARVRVLHSGIDCRALAYTERGRAAEATTRVLMVGRLVEKKGIADGLRAVATVLASGRALECTIVGDGPLRSSLERLVLELGLGRSVTMVGWKSHDEALGLMASADILLAPSRTGVDGDEEGIPNTVKEAMALGIPVVSTAHAGIPELVTDGLSGFLVPERDVAQLADRLGWLVDHPERWAAMGREGRLRIEAEFDIEKLNDDLLALYRESATAPTPGAHSAVSLGSRVRRGRRY